MISVEWVEAPVLGLHAPRELPILARVDPPERRPGAEVVGLRGDEVLQQAPPLPRPARDPERPRAADVGRAVRRQPPRALEIRLRPRDRLRIVELAGGRDAAVV